SRICRVVHLRSNLGGLVHGHFLCLGGLLHCLFLDATAALTLGVRSLVTVTVSFDNTWIGKRPRVARLDFACRRPVSVGTFCHHFSPRGGVVAAGVGKKNTIRPMTVV